MTDHTYRSKFYGVKLQTRHRTPTLSPAAGMGVADENTEESVTDYCGPFIYEDGELTRINLENGYLSYRSYAGQRLEVPEYVFYLRDHLGNNRVTMSANGGIYQIDHFYPFGLPMGCSYNSTHQQWRFGGKEFDRTAGLDLYDFEARAYDPSTARFTRPDDLSEKYHPISPMVFCLNNPLIFRDPTGKEGIRLISEDGKKMIILNIVILTQPKKKIESWMTEKETKKIQKYNAKIDKTNNNIRWKIEQDLNRGYGNARNSNGDPVEFKFNFIMYESADYNNLKSRRALEIANEFGLPAKLNPRFDPISRLLFPNSLAVVVSQTKPHKGRMGQATGPHIQFCYDFTKNVFSHELGHTFGLDDGYKTGVGSIYEGIMGSDPQQVTPSEVDEIWENANDILP